MRTCFLLLILAGCQTYTNIPEIYGQPTIFKRKYRTGDCVRFNKQEIEKQGKTSDGTPMFIAGYKRMESGEIRYVVTIKHKRIDVPVQFTAVTKVFDRDTDKIECPQ